MGLVTGLVVRKIRCAFFEFRLPRPCVLMVICLLQLLMAMDSSLAGQTPSVDTRPTQEVRTDQTPETATISEDAEDLLKGDLADHWQNYSSEPPDEKSPVWRISTLSGEDEPILVCTGTPKGFLLTRRRFEEFELALEWRFPRDADGNSGVLVFTQNEPRIWPTSVQIQLHQPMAGSVFPSGDAVTDNTTNAVPDLIRPVGVWNECRVIGAGGRMSVEVNGRKIGEVTGAKPAVGGIALQSEGSEVHFRRIRLYDRKPLAVETPAKPAATLPTGN